MLEFLVQTFRIAILGFGFPVARQTNSEQKQGCKIYDIFITES